MIIKIINKYCSKLQLYYYRMKCICSVKVREIAFFVSAVSKGF